MTLKISGRKSGHTRAVAPTISLDQPGRLRVANLMAILAVSHSTLYAGIKTGRYPKPDGYDGNMPYWNTETIREFRTVRRERATPIKRKVPTAPPANLLAMLSGKNNE